MLYKIILPIMLTLGIAAQAEQGLHNPSKKSVIFLVKIDQVGIKKNSILKQQIYPAFKKLKQSQFSSTDVYFLVKDISFAFSIMAKVANREIADYDLMVRLDLGKDLNEQQLQALLKMKQGLQSYFGPVVVFASKNYPFHKAIDASNTDVAMAFINRWHPDLTKEQAQDYWFNNHGPFVMKTGLPPVVKSYTQVHTDLSLGDTDLFDLTYQGLSFETITSQTKLVTTFVKSPALRKLNEALMMDELNFTTPPLLFAFKRWSL